jgi:hypothetical protein
MNAIGGFFIFYRVLSDLLQGHCRLDHPELAPFPSHGNSRNRLTLPRPIFS